MPQFTLQQAFDLAFQHYQSHRLLEAQQILQKIIAHNPAHFNSLYLSGLIACHLAQYDASQNLLRQAIALNPNLPEIYNDLGNTLSQKGHVDEAITAYRQAIALNPNYPDAYNNLGNVLGDTERLDEAIAAFRHAIALRPAYTEAYSNLGNALKNQGHLDEAIAAFRHALALKPSYIGAFDNLILTFYYHPDFNAQALSQELNRWNLQYAQPLKKLQMPHPNDHNPNRPLRIGYVSADFRTHASSLFLVPLFENHNPAQFELFCYAQVSIPDDITRRLQKHVPHWRTTVGLTDNQIAAQIRQDQIDILVDLKLQTIGNRLLVFAQKPAPLQVTWLGYPGSTGLPTIDYRLSDPYLDPPGTDESVYSEKTLRLPHTFWCYDPLDAREVRLNPLPALTHDHITYGCLNNFTKLNDTVLHLFAQVLQSVPNSRLLLLVPEGSPRQHTSQLFQQQGLSLNRVEFLPRQSRQQYLHAYHRIDIGLDTFPYNGHTTSFDSLWMGVPVITLPGCTPVSRAGVTLLTNLNLPNLIAQTPQQYIQIATTLANDLPRLTHLRATLRDRMQSSPLMNAPLFAQNIESAYRTIWQTVAPLLRINLPPPPDNLLSNW